MKLPRPYIPYPIRVQVAARQAFDAGIELNEEGSMWPYTRQLRELLFVLFGDAKVHLDHDPALCNRTIGHGPNGEIYYEPAANNPDFLIYRTSADHRIKTIVRGDGAQRSDFAQRRYLKRLEQKPKKKFKPRRAKQIRRSQMMRPSLLQVTVKLSKLQRDFLIEHVDGLKPFIDKPQENATRESLIIRELIRYEPNTHSILGIPKGTRLTDPDGRDALSFILGCYADGLTRWARVRDEKLIDPSVEIQLQQALRYSARESKRHELRNQNATPPEIRTIGHAYDRPAVPAKS